MNVTISRQRLMQLEDVEKRLYLLEDGGVKNWDNYDNVLSDYFGNKQDVAEKEQCTHMILEMTGSGMETFDELYEFINIHFKLKEVEE